MRTAAYREWIDANVSYECAGKCAEITEAMVAAFPLLRRARGHYTDIITGRDYTHWWCLDGDTVIDPTASQFPDLGRGVYIEHSGQEPTGRCPNCSGYCYDGGTCCSEVCDRAYAAYVMGGVL